MYLKEPHNRYEHQTDEHSQEHQFSELNGLKKITSLNPLILTCTFRNHQLKSKIGWTGNYQL